MQGSGTLEDVNDLVEAHLTALVVVMEIENLEVDSTKSIVADELMGRGSHSNAPSSEKNPNEQFEHRAGPVEFLKLPASHGLQVVPEYPLLH
jgi:hypothetical protein